MRKGMISVDDDQAFSLFPKIPDEAMVWLQDGISIQHQILKGFVENGIFTEEMLSEAIQQVGEKTPDAKGRKHIVSVRISDEALYYLNELVTAGFVQNQSEAAAFLVDEGIKHQASLLADIGKHTQEIQRIQEQMKAEVEQRKQNEDR